jgi:hypothetical protein
MAERTIIDLSNENINDVPETRILDKGEEVEIRITGFNAGEDKNSNPYIMFFYETPEDPDVEEFSEFVGLPNANRPERDNKKARRQLKAIGDCFGIDWSQPVDRDAVKGLRGFVIVGIGKDRDGKPCNVVDSYLTRR